MLGCGNTASTAENASPEALYSADRDIDLFVYEDTAYVNAMDVDWVGELSLAKGEALGEIGRSGVTDDFQDWDATVLTEGTVIYSSGETEVLLAADPLSEICGRISGRYGQTVPGAEGMITSTGCKKYLL